MTRPWWNGPMMGFDLETNGLANRDNARILTAALVPRYPGQPFELPPQVVINPLDHGAEGVGATHIHGLTEAFIRANGRQPAETIEYIRDVLMRSCEDGVPITGMNLVYDLTLLDTEARRYRMKTLTERLRASGLDVAPVIDVLVIDRAMRKIYDNRGKERRDGRRLGELAEHYRIELTDAHSAIADTAASMRLAWRIGVTYADRLDMSVMDLHRAQQRWHAAWALASTWKPIPPEWPILPWPHDTPWPPDAAPAQPALPWADATPDEAAALAGLAAKFDLEKVAELR